MLALAQTSQKVLMHAADRALRAPSVFNTQPWRWQVGADRLTLYADESRILASADPDQRLLTISCGITLHHARVALAAAGHAIDVDRLPDPTQPDLLAHVRLAGPHRTTTDDLVRADAIDIRHTDRRAFADTPVPTHVTDRLRAAAEAEGGHLHLVREDQMPMLAIATAKAATVEMADPAYRSELIRWTNRPQWSGDGVPQATAVRPTARRVPVREFTLDPQAGIDPGAGHDRGAVYAIVFGDSDNLAGWLRAGEAASAVLLTATSEGLATEPMSDVVEIPHTRELLRGLLCGIGYPQLVLRIGLAVPAPGDPPSTPRRPGHETIEYPDR